MRFLFAVVLLCLSSCWGIKKITPAPLRVKSSLKSYTNADPLEVFIIPHTHDDVGWLTTVDDYYVGTVQFIIDTVVTSLKENPNRKFTYVEMAYWSRWWNEQTDEVKATVQTLVDNGQLDFNIGGWTMHDEACTHYDRQINSFTDGNQFLYRTLGKNSRPTVGWQVDPFGHSSESASIWADNGFDAFGADRIDYRVKDQMAADKQLEFVWRGSTSLGSNFDIWVHVLESFYCTPSECGYDGGKTINPDPNLPTYGVDTVQQGQDFVNYARSINAHYPHNYILIPYGCDFAHDNAHRDFKEMDILMDYVNSNASLNTHMQYGHFKDYVAAINKLNLTWNVYTGDFFPYASGANSYWTGYFVSHPQYKGHLRVGSALLRQGEILNTLTFSSTQDNGLLQDTQSSIDYMRQAMSIGTHHDGVTGTSKSFVYTDYELQLTRGSDQVNTVVDQLTGKLVGSNPPTFSNDTVGYIGSLTASSTVAVVVHNSLGWTRREFVSVPVNRTDIIVVDSTGGRVISQIDPVPSFSNSKTSNYILYFLASVPAVGFATYFVNVASFNDVPIPMGQLQAPLAGSIANDFYTVNWDDTNRLSSIQNKVSGLTTKFTHDLLQYRSATGGPQASGAYVFRPAEDNLLGIGSDQGSDPTGHGTTNFIVPFASGVTPILVASAAGGNYGDTFAIGIRSISNTQVTANAYRVDEDDWGQNLGAMFLALAPGTQPFSGASGFQSGQIDVGSSTTICKTTSFNFPNAFKSAPYIILTTVNTQVNDDIVLSTIQSSSTTGATVNSCRVQKGEVDWGQDIKLNWLAWDSSVVVPAGVQYGRTTVGASSGLAKPTIRLSTGVVSAAFLSTARAGSSSYTTTTIDIEFNSVTLNVRRYDNGAWTDTGVSLDWIAFPKNEIVNPVVDPKTVLTSNTINGPFVKSFQTVWKTGYAQTVRLFQDGSGNVSAQTDLNHIRLSYDIGTIDSGAEVVTHFATDIPTNGEFNGDANGLERRPRKYNASISEPVAGNFYPFVQSASINGNSAQKDIQLTFVGDRARSVASLGNGNIQIMIHRRCLQDDGYGVGEVLDDQTKITVEFYVTLDTAQNSALLRHRYQLLQNYPPLALVAKTTSVNDYKSKWQTTWTALVAPLPNNLHLLSLEVRNPTPSGVSPQGDRFILLRLHHIFEQGESTQYSVPVNFNISNLFVSTILPINTLEETILSGTLARSALNRLQWKTASPNPMDEVVPLKTSPTGLLKDFVVTINPREIKTYRVNSSPLSLYL